MLIGTLPTLVSDSSLILAERMISHPLVLGVRYNTGGDSPFEPMEILTRMKELTDKYDKTLYVDLEGRQLRLARWTLFKRKALTLNRDFSVVPPAKVHVRGAGWFDLVAADPTQRKIYIDGGPDLGEYYFGESQSVHVIGGDFKVRGYLGGLDREYIRCSIKLGIACFMLSFFEEESDLKEFHSCFPRRIRRRQHKIFKIESQKALGFIRNRQIRPDEQLMAARDDLFLSFGDKPIGIIEALKDIIMADPFAIVASRILQGFQLTGGVTMGDITDIILMSRIGYKNFMFSDGLAKKFSEAIKIWEEMR